jgi:hypothetical protein
MFIFSRRKKLTVDFVTNDYKAYEYFSIDKSNKFIPQWWKDIPQQYMDDNFKVKGTRLNTLKRCPGFMDVFRYSYTMPLWTSCEIIVNDKINEEGYSTACADGTLIDSHPSYQAGSFLSSNSFIHFKFHTPWNGYSSKSRDLLWNWSPAVWNNPILLNKLFIPTAFRNFRGGTSTNIHTFMDSSNNDVLYIEAGTPMIHMIPMTDKNVEVKCHFDPDWYSRLQSSMSTNFATNGAHYARKKHF